MELYKEILIRLLAEYDGQISSPECKESLKDIIEMKCYQALQQIKNVINDDSFDDPHCFMRIEEIISALEEIGSNGGAGMILDK